MTGSLADPLLSTDLEAAKAGRERKIQLWLKALSGCAPLLAQLPTDLLGPADQHRWTEVESTGGSFVGADAVERLAGLGGGLEEALVVGLAALLGRYARANELALGLWRQGSGGGRGQARCLPLRVNLLRPADERPAEEEDSAITPASAFASARAIMSQVSAAIAGGDVAEESLDAVGLAALDVELSREAKAGTGPPGVCQALEVGVALGRGAIATSGPLPALLLVCPRWPLARERPMALELRYMRGCFSPQTAKRVLAHLTALVHEMSLAADAPICQLPLMRQPSAELAVGLNLAEVSDVSAWGDAYSRSCYCPKSSGHWSADRSITSLIDESVAAAPEAVALIDDGAGVAYTYSQLSAATAKVAHALRSCGVGRDTLVPLMSARGASMVIGMIGILRAGGAYVPLDLHWPDERLSDVLQQCGAKVAVGAQAVCGRLEALGALERVVCVEEVVSSTDAPAESETAKPEGTDLVYVFFTSGTTGKPKGVMVEHRGLSHRIHWFQQRWPLCHGEGVMQKVAYTFGLSEWEIFWPLCSKAALVLAPPGGEKDADYILQRACGVYRPDGQNGEALQVRLAAHVFVPSMLQMLLERYDELEEEEMLRKPGVQAASGTWWRMAPMRQAITCGEPLSAALAQKLFSRFPGCGLVNLYGPTEGEMSAWDVPKGQSLGRVPGGGPMDGSKTILMDLRERRAASSLEPAEITFGGPFIARGYLGRPDLDEKAFIPDFTDAGNAARLYLTGDLGRWREGEIELLGRRDFQIKLRGFRIELGEIESAVRAAGSRAAVCVVRPGAGGAPALVAYYEPGAEGAVSEAAVRQNCQRMLPPYMQPQILVQLEKLPRNANGKVDRAKLPKPPEQAQSTSKAAQAAISLPESETERAIAAAWAEVLGLDAAKVSVDADFQELGGSSLLAGRATAIIRKQLKVQGLPGTAIYKHPTVRRLAVLVDACLAAQGKEETEEDGAGTAAGMQLVPALQPPPSATLSSTRPAVLFTMGLGIFVLNFLFESQAWSPFWWIAWFLYEYYGRTALFMYLPFAVILDMVTQILVLVALKWLVVGRLRPGVHPLWSMEYMRWWFVSQLLHHASENAMPLVADTPLAGVLLRLLGAKVGSGARIGVCEITEPDLVTIGDGVTIGKQVRLGCSAVLKGSLHLGEIKIGAGAAVGHCAVLAQGTEVPAKCGVSPLSTMPGWHGAVGAVAYGSAEDRSSAEFKRKQGLLRVFVGMPLVMLLHTLPYVPCVFVLEWLWAFMSAQFGDRAFDYFAVVLAWIYVHPLWMSLVAGVVLQKWLLVGRLAPGPREQSHWAELRYWLHARAVESHDFAEVCEMWVNTEVLTGIYRLLGARIGKRVQMDHFHAVEHDCIQIEDYTVFGSEVLFSCDARAPWLKADGRQAALGFEPIRVGRASNVLDHCTLGPGVVVAERAVLGTCTLAPQGAYYPPLAIQSGSVRGKSLHLREHKAQGKTRELENKAMRDLDSPMTWWGFNAIIATIVVVAKPIPEAIWVITYFSVTAVWDPDEGSLIELLTIVPIIYNIIELIMLFVSIAAKWIIIGRYKAGDFPFFANYHVRWMAMIILGGGMSALTDALHGTPFEAWHMRANGAKVGKDCYLAGLAVEFDLLEVGDRVSIGPGCDTTGHTVENMVIKLARTRVESGASMLPASFAMPGSVVEEGAVLLEHTQVLKGEVVPQGEVWAGMPAAQCRPGRR